jgi:hypothetical protein
MMQTPALRAIRRIVTEDDSQGRSRIAEDASCKAVRTVPERPGYQAVKNLGDRPRFPEQAPIAMRIRKRHRVM